MRYSEKPPGMTLAEALGIVVPDDAPGGQPMLGSPSPGAQRNSKAADSMGVNFEYDGFHDVDGYGRSEG